MDRLSQFSKKIKKGDFPRKKKKKDPHFSSKMNQSNTFFEEKPDFDLLAIKYPELEP